ncbi:hypothetical protein B1748_29035 [Paenibacillus sp. MY03]|uniref:hypothetical protein n=1 Tax=Paenibacillus sp. MY03 TaxID=302980 RepID=UPI000B3C20B8|nr:hypothetical protein [Paenibacillus sp. MY03]OUS70283.1 hypothetical protein B1748_29035 [Paenibacillus sp. MY03]
MSVEQIDLFDILPPAELPWKSKSYDPHRLYCNVLAMIPKRVLSPTERWGIQCTEAERKAAYDEWGEYAMAIWHYQWSIDRKWEKCIRQLSDYRDRGEPIWMEIVKGGFMPEKIIEVF